MDAVLTDLGRQFLARNDGSFSVVKFACADDSLDYSIITKYGRTVGKEKLEKNTLVPEALTNQNHGLKYKLLSISNPNLIRLPNLSLSGDANVNSSTSTVTLGRTLQRTSTILVEQIITNETTIDVELRDQTFIVTLNNIFLQIVSQSPDNIDGNQVATYILPRAAAENSFGGSRLQFTVSSKSLSDAQYTTFGSQSDKTTISSYVTVTGVQSGNSKTFRVNISKNL